MKHLFIQLSIHRPDLYYPACLTASIVPGSYYPASITYTCDPSIIHHLQPISGSCKDRALWTKPLSGTRKTWQGLCNHNKWTITCSQPSGPIVGPCDINTNCDPSALSKAFDVPNFNELVKRCMDCVTGNLGIGTFAMDRKCQAGTSGGGGCYNFTWVVSVV